MIDPTLPGRAGRYEMAQKMPERAAALAERDFCVFPLQPNSKLPAVRFKTNRAWLRDPDQVRAEWWTDDAFNIGIYLGPSHLIVIDIDVATSLSRALDLLPCAVPDTLTIRTGRGKWHLIFSSIDQGWDYDGNCPVIGKGDPVFSNHRIPGTQIDLKAHNGYVVGAGSVFAGGEYVIEFDDPVVPFPQELIAWATAKPGRPRREPARYRKRGREALKARRTGLLRAIREAEDGELNSTLYWAACRAGEMISDGQWNEDKAEYALELAALEANLEPWRVLPTIDSGISRGMGES